MEYELNLTNDYLFRCVLGDRKNSAILLSFVNAVMEPKGFSRLSSIETVDPHLGGDSVTQKEAILDVRAVDADGRQYDIEIQVRREPDYIKRSLYYLAKLYAGQLVSGDKYRNLKACIGINLLDYIQFEDSPDLHSCFTLRSDIDPRFELTRELCLHYIELPKLKRETYYTSLLEKWVYFIENVYNSEDILIEQMKSEVPEIDQAAQEYERMMADLAVKARAMSREKWVRDQASYREAAREDGFAEGKAQGLAEGKAEGKAEGLLEAKRETARKLKARGFELSEIAEITNLSATEIANL